jgi:MIP family channel proteins
VAELLGTFMLLFFGLGTIVAVEGAGEAAQIVAIALAFGFAILAAVYAFGHTSGAHLNPAVTLALVASGRFPRAAAPLYIGAQVLGAVLGALAIEILLGGVDGTVTEPGPESNVGKALLAELILGFVLMLVIKATAVDDRAEGPSSGLAIGLTIAIGHLAMIPVSGASFNPARSLASAVVGTDFTHVLIYLVAPVVGAVAAALLYERVLIHVRVPDVDE